MDKQLEYIERLNKVGIKPDGVVIWLHGLGADCNDFAPLVPELKVNHSLKFIFPNALMRPITINNGYVMRAWYDITDFSRLANAVDKVGIEQSIKQIENLISKQVEDGFSPGKIILAGFSQGGVMSYLAGLNSKYKLAGILALSCYLPELSINHNNINKTTPIFACHGNQDTVVPLLGGIHAYQELKKYGYNIAFTEYPMAHSVCLEQLEDISKWIDQCLYSS